MPSRRRAICIPGLIHRKQESWCVLHCMFEQAVSKQASRTGEMGAAHNSNDIHNLQPRVWANQEGHFWPKTKSLVTNPTQDAQPCFLIIHNAIFSILY